MVKFYSERKPAQGMVYLVSSDSTDLKLVLKAKKGKVIDAVAYWLESDRVTNFIGGQDSFDTRYADFKDERVLEGDLNVNSIVGDKVSDNAGYQTVLVSAESTAQGTLVNITVDFGKEIKAKRVWESQYKEQELGGAIFKWLKDNPERVTLGYGPNHPLDDLHPVAVSEDYVPATDGTLLDEFREWMLDITNRTIANEREHAFYIDENDNVIGTLQGGYSSVMYPSSKKSEILVSAHTHPKLRGIAFPSKTDLNTNAHRCGPMSAEMIINANASTHLDIPSETDKNLDEYKGRAEYPFEELPVVTYTREVEMDDDERRAHHERQIQKVDDMLTGQVQHKVEQINSVEGEVSDSVFSMLQSEVGTATDLKEKVVAENEGIEVLNNMGDDNNLKYTFVQDILSL